MDPLTQGVLGGALPRALAPKKHAGLALLLGLLAGMAPDLDVLIRSDSDPLLFLEYHRQFTHSLLFIPVGGLACAALLHPLFSARAGLGFRYTLLYCTLGYATHALLDACTSYGTQLFWPLSQQRFAWNNVSVIDPLFTLPLGLLLLLSLSSRKALYARMALVWALAYLGTGVLQRDRAEAFGYQLAASRGHQPERLAAKPSFGNILLWKVVYETEDMFYVDAVRTGLGLSAFPGDKVAKLDVARDFPWLAPETQQARDIERFRWFSDDYLAVDPANPQRVTDIRYSLLPNRVRGLWSIELRPQAAADAHVSYVVSRAADDATLAAFKRMLFN
ncbi:MAG: metal-dependent hydrolase [Halieaceae bacterium]|nr:metal-dependent hydrolase [Halieaceae bacterium]